MYTEELENHTKVGMSYRGIDNKTATEARTGEVQHQYNDLTQSINFLAETIDCLRVRLEPVLAPSPLADKNGLANAPEQAISPLAETIRSDRKRVDELRLMLDNIVSRIDL